MFKIDFNLIIYRYEAIVVLIILLLTGSITVSSKDDESTFPPSQRYPYRIVLTFDDGPHTGFTDRIIALLKKDNVRATFFLVGSRMQENPGLVQNLAREGHELAGHTLSHRNLSRLPEKEIEKELLVTRSMIQDLTGQDGRFFRPPGGQFNNKVLSVSGRLGIDMVLWSVFPKDHQEDNPDVIVQKVLAQATDNGVILLHSGRPATMEALPVIIKELRQRGYRFATISQLFHNSKNKQFAWLK